MTTEIRTMIENMMTETCGMPWYDTNMTEAQCESVCARCPYYGKCHDSGMMWSCPCWEESMGEDL